MTFAEAALPVHLKGGSSLGILMIHGFTSTPASVKPWGEALNKALGATVVTPLLPGHGTVWQDLNKVRWQDWEKTVLNAFDALAATHSNVVVAGLSLGGTLACLVAARRPQLKALILVNHLMWLGNPLVPFAPLIKRLIASTPAIAGDIKMPGSQEWAYDQVPTGGVDQMRLLMKTVRPLLAGITVPVLTFKSREDHVIPVASTLRTQQRLGAARKDLVWLENSFHVATLDNDLPLIVEKSAAFVKEIVKL